VARYRLLVRQSNALLSVTPEGLGLRCKFLQRFFSLDVGMHLNAIIYLQSLSLVTVYLAWHCLFFLHTGMSFLCNIK